MFVESWKLSIGTIIYLLLDGCLCTVYILYNVPVPVPDVGIVNVHMYSLCNTVFLHSSLLFSFT